jgi:microcystin-dependent protein
MDKSIVNPKFQIFDLNGDPLSGGLVYTYDTGTTNAKTTYSDRALTTPNANPVVLDTRGECVIYCSGTIKIVVKTSAGATVWTMDNMKALTDIILSDADGDTKVQVEESADEDIIRFDTGGTQRAIIDSNGLTLASGASINEFSIDGTFAGNSDDAVPTEKAVRTYLGTHFLVGAMIDWPTETVPTGWLERNGASLSKVTYAALFAIISDDYGSADADHFNLPDDRGRFRRYWDHGAGIDPDAAARTDRGDGTGADHVGSKQADGFKSHTHELNYVGGKNTAGAGTSDVGETGSASGMFTIANGGNETRPVNSYAMPLIKY